MIIYFTGEFSVDIENRFSFLPSYDSELKNFFYRKSYGDDLDVIYIGLFCMSTRFESFFKPRKPNYQSDKSIYLHQGVQVEREGKSLTYELRLNYHEYLESNMIKPLLARDILASLNTIGTVKKIKHFDLAAFRNDFEQFFRRNGWMA